MDKDKIDISVVVPLYNEAESLPELAEWIARVMDEHDFSYEVIMVDDGSTDESWKVPCSGGAFIWPCREKCVTCVR